MRVLALAVACGARRAPPEPLVPPAVQTRWDGEHLSIANRSRRGIVVEDVTCEVRAGGEPAGSCPRVTFLVEPGESVAIPLDAPPGSPVAVSGVVTWHGSGGAPENLFFSHSSEAP